MQLVLIFPESPKFKSPNMANESSEDPETTFYPFPRLPLEIQRIIWRLTIKPRIVTIRICARVYIPIYHSREVIIQRRPPGADYIRVPAILQANRESRGIGLQYYQPAFAEAFWPTNNGPKQLYFNFAIDTLRLDYRSRDPHYGPITFHTNFFPLFDELFYTLQRLRIVNPSLKYLALNDYLRAPETFRVFNELYPFQSLERVIFLCERDPHSFASTVDYRNWKREREEEKLYRGAIWRNQARLRGQVGFRLPVMKDLLRDVVDGFDSQCMDLGSAVWVPNIVGV